MWYGGDVWKHEGFWLGTRGQDAVAQFIFGHLVRNGSEMLACMA